MISPSNEYKQQWKLKISYRFIPKCAWATCIIDFVVFRPFETMLAHHLQFPDVGDRFLSHLFPGITSKIKSQDISDALKRDTSKVLDNGIGLRDWRQVTVAFSDAHRIPRILEPHGDEPDNEIRGHTDRAAGTHYNRNLTTPNNITPDQLRLHHMTAHWWWDIVGISVFPSCLTELGFKLTVTDRNPKW